MENPEFDVILKSDVKDEDGNKTTILTMEKETERLLTQAMQNFDPSNRIYSSVLNDFGEDCSTVSTDRLNKLARNPQSRLEDILAINNIVYQYINKDDVIGKTYETIESNVNTTYKLSYNDVSEHRNKATTLKKAQSIIDDFNDKINIKSFIRNAVPTIYAEGNYCVYLRHQNDNYVVDYYPLGIALVSDYEVNGEPYLIVDMTKLLSKLYKDRITDGKGKSLFFDTLDEEIKASYPDEIYQAFKNRSRCAKLNIKYSGNIRIGNMNRKYGLTPIFRALKSALMLETFDHTDLVNSKAKAKKIIHQSLRKELMGPTYDRKGFTEMAYAHDNLMKAWKMPTVVVTTPPFVETIAYVEPKTENTSADQIGQYRSREMTSLGITFLASDKGQTVTTASMSIKELIKTVDKITENISDLLNKWYKVVLQENNISAEYAPTIKINSSEELSAEIKQQLAEFLFCKLGCSYETAMDTVGIDVDDEKQKRLTENDNEYELIFQPHPTAYNLSDNTKDQNDDQNIGGRPKKTTPDNKQVYDKTKNKAKNEIK